MQVGPLFVFGGFILTIKIEPAAEDDSKGKGKEKNKEGRKSRKRLNRHSTIQLDADRVPRNTLQYDKMGTIKVHF